MTKKGRQELVAIHRIEIRLRAVVEAVVFASLWEGPKNKAWSELIKDCQAALAYKGD